MNDADKELLTEAHIAFRDAFSAAFEEGQREVAESGVALPVETPAPFSVEVPWPHVRDKAWAGHLIAFADAGRKAATLSKTVALLPPDQSSSHAFEAELLQWQVLLGD
jgi:hypothetical protein